MYVLQTEWTHSGQMLQEGFRWKQESKHEETNEINEKETDIKEEDTDLITHSIDIALYAKHIMKDTWIADTGEYMHMMNDSRNLYDIEHVNQGVYLGDGNIKSVTFIGKMKVSIHQKDKQDINVI